MADVKRVEDREASNPNHWKLVKTPEEGEGACPECGCRIACATECHECRGSDEEGDNFCPVCEFCCGC